MSLLTSAPIGVYRKTSRMPTTIKLCLGFLVLIALIAILAPYLSPYSYAEQNLVKRLNPPVFMGGDWAYPLGTDNLGRDILTRLFYGIRTSISIALLGTFIGATEGRALLEHCRR